MEDGECSWLSFPACFPQRNVLHVSSAGRVITTPAFPLFSNNKKDRNYFRDISFKYKINSYIYLIKNCATLTYSPILRTAA